MAAMELLLIYLGPAEPTVAAGAEQLARVVAVPKV